GPSPEVVKAYQEFIQVLEDRRLRGKNRKLHSGYAERLQEIHTDSVSVRFVPSDDADSYDISGLILKKGGAVEDELHIGAAQDADNEHASFVQLAVGSWSEPRHVGARSFRSLRVEHSEAFGAAVFNLFHFDKEA